MHIQPMLQRQQPAGYVPGAGRGAVGFQTAGDLGPASRIVTNYKPKPKKRPQVVFTDPTTGLAVQGDINQHMRLQLLNPQWRQQQQLEQMKSAHTNYAQGEETAEALATLARDMDDESSGGAQRGDPIDAMPLAEQISRIRADNRSMQQHRAVSDVSSQQQLAEGTGGWVLGAHQGAFYFWDPATHTSVWAANSGCDSADLQKFVGQQWSRGVDPACGRTYFYHEASQQSVWELDSNAGPKRQRCSGDASEWHSSLVLGESPPY